MGFLKPVAKVATFGLAGLALGNKKKKTDETKITPRPSMINESGRSLINVGQPTKQLY